MAEGYKASGEASASAENVAGGKRTYVRPVTNVRDESYERELRQEERRGLMDIFQKPFFAIRPPRDKRDDTASVEIGGKEYMVYNNRYGKPPKGSAPWHTISGTVAYKGDGENTIYRYESYEQFNDIYRKIRQRLLAAAEKYGMPEKVKREAKRNVDRRSRRGQ